MQEAQRDLLKRGVRHKQIAQTLEQIAKLPPNRQVLMVGFEGSVDVFVAWICAEQQRRYKNLCWKINVHCTGQLKDLLKKKKQTEEGMLLLGLTNSVPSAISESSAGVHQNTFVSALCFLKLKSRRCSTWWASWKSEWIVMAPLNGSARGRHRPLGDRSCWALSAC